MRFALAALALSTSVLVAACSEPVPQSPDGAVHLIHSASTGGCNIFDFTAVVGEVNNAERTTVTDGQNGTKVSCSVLNAAAPFEVRGRIDDSAGNSGNFVDIYIPAISKTATEDAPAVGTVTYSSTVKTASNAFTGQCNFFFEANSNEGVDPGKIWVAFTCASVSSPQTTCAVQKAWAIFENCLTESTTE